MYITNNPDVALVAEKNAVQRIWIDLETLGKQERQHNINSVKSHHCVSDIEIISKLLTNSELLVRVNPMNPCSEHEINQVIEAGADMIMLPMWKPMHMQPIYRTNPFVTVEGNGRGRTNAYIKGSGIDVGADIFRRGLCLPSDNKMTEEQQDRIIEIIHRCFL